MAPQVVVGIGADYIASGTADSAATGMIGYGYVQLSAISIPDLFVSGFKTYPSVLMDALGNVYPEVNATLKGKFETLDEGLFKSDIVFGSRDHSYSCNPTFSLNGTDMSMQTIASITSSLGQLPAFRGCSVAAKVGCLESDETYESMEGPETYPTFFTHDRGQVPRSNSWKELIEKSGISQRLPTGQYVFMKISFIVRNKLFS